MTGRIDRSSDRPAYKQLADILRDQIHTGELAAGADLPSKKQLSELYEVSITGVVEPALAELKSEGLIVSERGRNSRVRPIRNIGPSRYEAGARNYGPHQESNFAAEHGVPFSQFDLTREYRTIEAPARVSAALGLQPGAEVVERRWTHAVDGVMLRVSWSYLDAARYGDTILCDPDEPPWPGGTIAQLVHLGRRPVTDPPTEVRARPGTDEECELLGLDPGTFVQESFRIHIEQGAIFNSWTALECAVHVYPWWGQVLSFNAETKRRWNAGD